MPHDFLALFRKFWVTGEEFVHLFGRSAKSPRLSPQGHGHKLWVRLIYVLVRISCQVHTAAFELSPNI